MGKPDWGDAPKWAKWLAQDADGEWFWWKAKPRPGGADKFWVPVKFSGPFTRAMRGAQNPDWAETLERRP